MQKTVAEIVHIESFGGVNSIENPKFEYNRVLGGTVSGFPIYRQGISNVLVSRSYDLDIAYPVFSLCNCSANIWFENITRSYWT